MIKDLIDIQLTLLLIFKFMNRKISTLFTAGLLMAGSLCGSAWAQSSIQQLAGFVNGQGTFTATPATELKAGHQYVFVNDQTNNEAYGHELSGSTITESTIGLSTPLADNDDVKQYVWTVGITESPKGFFFILRMLSQESF